MWILRKNFENVPSKITKLGEECEQFPKFFLYLLRKQQNIQFSVRLVESGTL